MNADYCVRQNFAPGFSDRALKDQEPLLNKHFELLMQRLRERTGETIDISTWLQYLTFDIIGDMTFGESFGCLETQKTHVSSLVGPEYSTLEAQ